jgi:DNA invertase Pin-like site-specific DNA recombinase
MIFGYARVSTDGQSVETQVRRRRAAGAARVFREVASGARADRPQLRRAVAQLEEGDVLIIMRLDRLARSTRDLLNTLAAIAEKKAGFRSLGDAWADTTTPHGRSSGHFVSTPCFVRWEIFSAHDPAAVGATSGPSRIGPGALPLLLQPNS